MDEQEEQQALINLAERLDEPEESEECVTIIVKLDPETQTVLSVEELA
jgi:hypothetical protein